MVGLSFTGCSDRPCQRVSFAFSLEYGVVANNCDRWLPIDPLLHCITHTQSKVVVLDVERTERISHALQGLRSNGVTGILVFDSTGRVSSRSGVHSWSTVMAVPRDCSHVILEDPDVQNEDNATIIFTSGT